MIDKHTKDLAKYSNDSYKNNSKESNCIIERNNKLTGFQGKAYINEENKEIVIAYAGTDSLTDVVNDGLMALGISSYQFKEAKNLYKDIGENELYKGYKITLTGNSLGGMLATQVKLDLIKDALGENVTKENFLAKKKDLPDVTVFETPSLFLAGDISYKGELWEKYKDILGLFGYELASTKYENVLPIVYNPKKDQFKEENNSSDIHELGITTYQNAYSELSQAYGVPIGVINNVEAYNNKSLSSDVPILSTHLAQHQMENLLEYLYDDSTIIRTDYQNELIGIYPHIYDSYDWALQGIKGIGSLNISSLIVNKWIKDFQKHANTPKKTDPLVLDLNSDGVKINPLDKSKSYFNLNNYSDFAPRVEWLISNTDDGFLCIDKNQNGTIDSGNELFMERQTLSDGTLSKNGIEVLKDMDTNKDGFVDKNDKDFDKLLFWNDANADGISQKEELHTLEEMEIEKFQLNKDNYTAKGYFSDGKSFLYKDVNFEDRKIDTRELLDSIPVNFERIQNVPYIPHLGFVKNLWETSMENPNIEKLFKQYHNSFKEDQDKILNEILYQWAGTQNISNGKERKAMTIIKFGKKDLPFETLKNCSSWELDSQMDSLKGVIRVMDFFQSNLGERVLKAWEKDVSDKNSKSYENVKKEIIEIGKEDAKQGSIAMESFWSFVFSSKQSEFYDYNKKNDFEEFKRQTHFISEENFDQTIGLSSGGHNQNIIFDKSINQNNFYLRQETKKTNLLIDYNNKTLCLERFSSDYKKINPFITFYNDDIWDKEKLKEGFILRPKNENDTTELSINDYSDFSYVVQGNKQDNSIKIKRNTTVHWGVGSGNDTVAIIDSNTSETNTTIILDNLNFNDVEFNENRLRVKSSTSTSGG